MNFNNAGATPDGAQFLEVRATSWNGIPFGAPPWGGFSSTRIYLPAGITTATNPEVRFYFKGNLGGISDNVFYQLVVEFVNGNLYVGGATPIGGGWTRSIWSNLTAPPFTLTTWESITVDMTDDALWTVDFYII